MERLLADATKLTGIKYDISNLGDVYQAIHAIQEKIGITGTTALEASETVSGSFNAMKASFSDFLGNLALGNDMKMSLENLFLTTETFLVGNLLPMIGRIFKGLPQVAEVGFIELEKRFESLGKIIMQKLAISLSDNPVLSKAFSNINQAITPLIKSIKTNLMKIPELFSSMGQSMIPIIETIVVGFSKLKFDGIKDLVDIILPSLSAAFQSLISTAEPVIVTLSNSFPKLWNSLAPVIEAIKSSIIQIPDVFTSIGQTINPIIETIITAIGRLKFDGIATFIQTLLPALSSGFQTFISIASPAVKMLANSFVNLWNSLQPVISSLADALMPTFQVLASFLGGIFKGILIGISSTFDVLSATVKFLSPIIDILVAAFKSVAPALSLVAERIGTVIGLFTGMGAGGKNLSQIIKDAWANIKQAVSIAGQGIKTIITGIKGFFTNLAQAGGSLKELLSTAWSAIKTAISTAASAIGTVINNVKSFFTSLNSTGQSLSNGLRSAWTAITNVISNAVSRITGFVNKIKSMFNSIRNIDLRGAGSSIMNGFLGGLKSAWGAVKSFVGGIANWIKRHKGPISYDKKLLVPAGKAIMQGLDKGLVKNFENVKYTVAAMNNEIIDQFSSDDIFGNSNINKSVNYSGVLESSSSINQDYLEKKNPVQLIFDLNGRVFEALVDDITEMQNKKIKLEASY